MTAVSKLDGQMPLFGAPPRPVQAELELEYSAPRGECCQCGATSDLISLGAGDSMLCVCRLPGVCALRQSLANSRRAR